MYHVTFNGDMKFVKHTCTTVDDVALEKFNQVYQGLLIL